VPVNAFQGILWQGQGIGLPMIGVLIALSAASETVMFFAYRRFMAGRFRARTVILASAALSAARWAVMAQAPALWVEMLLQASHGLTYAMGFLACMQFIANWTSEDIAAEVQGLFVVLQQGFAVAVVAGFGALMGPWGAEAHLASAALALAGAGAIWMSWRLQTP
jgi:PPP family 3-phenylpropionic acid transporter